MQNVHTTAAVIAAAAAIAVTALVSVYFYRRKLKTGPPKEWKQVGKVTKLQLYPLKSGRRIELNSAECTQYGIKQNKEEEKAFQLSDRSFVVFGENNNEFKTARTFPKMVLIEVSVHDENHVAFDAPGMRSLYVKLPSSEDTEGKQVKVHHGDEIFTLDCGDEAATWISRYIHGKQSGLRVGYHDSLPEHVRDISGSPSAKQLMQIYDHLGAQSAGLYSDLTAILLVNKSSVDDLNSKITSGTTITTENFRGSITIEGEEAPAYAEDDWDWVKIGDVIFRNVKPCTRCIMTTIDQETGVRNEDREPLNTLEKYRLLKDLKNIELEGKSPVMGIHLEVNTKGVIRLDDGVFVG